MAGRIRDDSIQQVRERAAIDQVIAESGVTLRSAGGGKLKGLCPFHDEKTPSFNVNPANGFYMCFGCGESGNVISFVTKHDHMSFPEAVDQASGIAVPGDTVLLSPAFASFDMFRNFAERGARFKELVARLAEQPSGRMGV